MRQVNVYSIIQCSKKDGSPKEAIHEGYRVRDNVKQGRVGILDNYLRQAKRDYPFIKTILNEEASLIPAPKSAPLLRNATWPSLEICKKLREYQLGGGIICALERTEKVPKSSFQDGAENRPGVKRHYDTIKCNINNTTNIPPENIVIVDDLITAGRTSCACYMRVQENFPDSNISIFTAVRTLSFQAIDVAFLPSKSLLKYFQSGKTYVKHLG